MESKACDVLVIGSGAAGMTAAITAQHFGCDVMVTEKAAQFGGTTARSGGWLWPAMTFGYICGRHLAENGLPA